MQAEGGQSLTIARLVNRADVRNTLIESKERRVNTAKKSEREKGANTYIASAVITQDKVEQRKEQVLGVFAASVCQEGAEWVQNDKVLVWRVE